MSPTTALPDEQAEQGASPGASPGRCRGRVRGRARRRRLRPDIGRVHARRVAEGCTARIVRQGGEDASEPARRLPVIQPAASAEVAVDRPDGQRDDHRCSTPGTGPRSRASMPEGIATGNDVRDGEFRAGIAGMEATWPSIASSALRTDQWWAGLRPALFPIDVCVRRWSSLTASMSRRENVDRESGRCCSSDWSPRPGRKELDDPNRDLPRERGEPAPPRASRVPSRRPARAAPASTPGSLARRAHAGAPRAPTSAELFVQARRSRSGSEGSSRTRKDQVPRCSRSTGHVQEHFQVVADRGLAESQAPVKWQTQAS